jgi:hypothetical protein
MAATMGILAVTAFIVVSYLIGNYALKTFREDWGYRLMGTALGMLIIAAVGYFVVTCCFIYSYFSTLFQ